MSKTMWIATNTPYKEGSFIELIITERYKEISKIQKVRFQQSSSLYLLHEIHEQS